MNNNDILEYDLNLSDFKFCHNEYNQKVKDGRDKKYLLSLLVKQKWTRNIIDFFHSDKKVLLLKNCPTDKKLPVSPIDTGYSEPNRYPLIRDFVLTLYKIMNIIPYSYKDENKGKLFRSVVPLKSEEKMVGSYGSRCQFNFHSDNPTYKIYPEYKYNSLNAPEFLSLFCIRNQELINTKIIALSDIIKLLDINTIEILNKKEFIVNTPNSFELYHEVYNVSVISSYQNKYYTRFDYHNIKGMNENAKKALTIFKEAIKSIEPFNITFKKGDFLIFKNQEVLHSRESFKTKYDGNDRWLLRIYGASNIGYLNHEEINKGDIGCI